MAARNKELYKFVVLCIVLFHGCIAPVTIRQMGSKKVPTRQGLYRGILVEFLGTSLEPIEAFLGLPYASLRSGQLRFIPPASFSRSSDNFMNANITSGVCPQPRFNDNKHFMKSLPLGRYKQIERVMSHTYEQREDCLGLNVYVPRKGELLDVYGQW